MIGSQRKFNRINIFQYLLLIPAVILTLNTVGSAQQTVLHSDARDEFSQLVKEYEQGLFGRCIRSADRFMVKYHENTFDQLVLEAELYKLKSGLRIESPGMLNTILAFSEKYKPEAVSDQAIMLLGENAYENQEYDKAIEYLGLVDGRALSPEDMSALNFKLGYVLFIG